VKWEILSETVKQEIQPGVWQVTKKAKAGRELELSLVFFDAKKTRTCVAAQASQVRKDAKSLESLASTSAAIAACNGGYFTPQFGPAGLEIAQGVRTGAWQGDLPFGGVFCVRQSVPALLPDRKFVDGADITDLVQCCPMLVQEGKVLRNIGGEEVLPRTFIATDGADRWLIGFSPRASMEDLAEALTTPGVLHEFRVQSAMNLDGGPSSGLWWKPAQGNAQGVRSTTMVRNAILVLPSPSK
jgi:hypothetical protein